MVTLALRWMSRRRLQTHKSIEGEAQPPAPFSKIDTCTRRRARCHNVTECVLCCAARRIAVCGRWEVSTSKGVVAMTKRDDDAAGEGATTTAAWVAACTVALSSFLYAHCWHAVTTFLNRARLRHCG